MPLWWADVRGFLFGDVLLKLVTPATLHDPIIGDLHERFYKLEQTHGRKTARRYYYGDLFASVPSLAWTRIATGLHDRWFSSLGAGLTAFAAVFGVLQIAERLRAQSAALTYGVMIAATCALCFVPRVVKVAGVLMLFLCVVAWTATFFVRHPIDRIELRSLDFYLRFVRLACAMVGATIMCLIVRRTFWNAKAT